jgi:IclR family acetate operon transcriptional repressor
MQTGTQSIERAAQLLVLVIERERSMGELAGAADLPKSTASRAVAALERHGLVQRDGPRGLVRPGPVLQRLAHRGPAHDDLVLLSRPVLERLSERSGETVDLAVPVPGGMEQYLAQIDSRHFLGTTNWVGRSLPNHCTSVGKVFLAHGAPAPPGRLERFTPQTITDRATLAQEVEEVRRRGYATTHSELEPGLMAVAAPVVSADGRAVAAVSISGPEFRLAGRVEELGELLLTELRPLSARLGWDEREGAA